METKVPSLIKKPTTLAHSQRGSSAAAKAREQATKPANRLRLEQLAARLGRKP
jgi:hypothetical protein